jgi:hypothetical protein
MNKEPILTFQIKELFLNALQKTKNHKEEGLSLDEVLIVSTEARSYYRVLTLLGCSTWLDEHLKNLPPKLKTLILCLDIPSLY